jgi:Fe-S-cluster-containing dehydrogenase component
VAAGRIPGAAAAAGPQEETQLATLMDISKCVGCEACVEACREANGAKYPQSKKPFPKMVPARVLVEDWSEKQDVTDRLTPYNWLYVQHVTVNVNGEETELTFPRRCMHCVNPPCVKLCPWGATRQLDNGISRIESDICLRGSKCKKVCPWDIPQRQTGTDLYFDILPSLAGNGVMYKYDRCYNRIADGELPACIEACPEEMRPSDRGMKSSKKPINWPKKLTAISMERTKTAEPTPYMFHRYRLKHLISPLKKAKEGHT